MKIPRSVEKSKGVRELNKNDGENRVEDQEVLEIHTNLEDENFVNNQNQPVQQKEQIGRRNQPKQQNENEVQFLKCIKLRSNHSTPKTLE